MKYWYGFVELLCAANRNQSEPNTISLNTSIIWFAGKWRSNFRRIKLQQICKHNRTTHNQFSKGNQFHSKKNFCVWLKPKPSLRCLSLLKSFYPCEKAVNVWVKIIMHTNTCTYTFLTRRITLVSSFCFSFLHPCFLLHLDCCCCCCCSSATSDWIFVFKHWHTIATILLLSMMVMLLLLCIWLFWCLNSSPPILDHSIHFTSFYFLLLSSLFAS